MANLKSGIVLAQDEQLVFEIEVTLKEKAVSIMGWLVALIRLILGYRSKGYLVVTTKNVVVVEQNKILWVLNQGKEVSYIAPASINEIGYTKTGRCCGCFCQEYNLFFESNSANVCAFLGMGDESQAIDLVHAFTNAVNNAK